MAKPDRDGAGRLPLLRGGKEKQVFPSNPEAKAKCLASCLDAQAGTEYGESKVTHQLLKLVSELGKIQDARLIYKVNDISMHLTTNNGKIRYKYHLQ